MHSISMFGDQRDFAQKEKQMIPVKYSSGSLKLFCGLWLGGSCEDW